MKKGSNKGGTNPLAKFSHANWQGKAAVRDKLTERPKSVTFVKKDDHHRGRKLAVAPRDGGDVIEKTVSKAVLMVGESLLLVLERSQIGPTKSLSKII